MLAMANLYVIQTEMSFAASTPSNLTTVKMNVGVAAVAEDGTTAGFPIVDTVAYEFSSTLGPTKTGLKDAVSTWATSKGHTLKELVYPDMSATII